MTVKQQKAETIKKKKTVKLRFCVEKRKQEMEKQTATLRLTDQFAIKKNDKSMFEQE